MNQKASDHQCSVAFDGERLPALSSLLRNSSPEIESQVHGGSMGGVLPEGSKIRIRFATENQLAAGQIITYVSKYGVVAHRLVRRVTRHDGHYLITRGDATVCCDVPVRTSAVIGIVTEFQNGGSWQAVGPPAARWFGFRWVAAAVSGVIVTVLKLNLQVSCSMATGIAGIRRSVLRAIRLARRFAPHHFSARAKS